MQDNESAHPSVVDHERLSSLINSMADGVLAIDEELKIVLYNGSALNILDVNGSIAGKPIAQVLQPVTKDGDRVDVWSLIHSANTPMTTRDYLLEYDDRSRSALYLSIAPVHLGYGKQGVQGYVLLLRDITHEKSLEEERDEFISVISHELRTPVTIAEGSLSNAIYAANQPKMDNKTVLDALQTAHEQVYFLANLINDLSMLSRADRDNLVLDITQINMRALLEKMIEGFNRQAQEKGLELEVDYDPKLELLESGKLYVEEVLQNLITNALKYTQKGSVYIKAWPTEKGVSVSVQDSGIGISKVDQEKIFQKFFRSEDYRTRESSGTGLGLYVTMKLIHLLRSDLEVTSELNQGSTFIVHFVNLDA